MQTEIATAETPTDGTPKGSSLTELFSGIIADAQLLFRQQVDLVRAEFLEDIRRTRQVAQYFGIGALLLFAGVVMLLVAAVYLLQQLTGCPMWASWAIVAGVVLLLGGISMIISSRLLASYNPLPDKAFNAIQETVSCLTNPPK